MTRSPTERRPIRAAVLVLALAALTAATTSCSVHRHRIGVGPGGHGERTARQFYLFWGLIRINDADTQRLAGDQSGYEIVTYFGWIDLLLSPLLLPLLTTSRTVDVKL